MNGAKLQEIAAARAQELPDAALENPFGPDWDVYKVQGKVFMLLTQVTGEHMVIVKSAPEDGKALQASHTHITPGYHMNKQHWITLTGGGDIDKALINELVFESYLLVVEKLPKARQPVDPKAFGQN
jgi:predicted DNA-binding protein (MmcQ/YjbR family)